MAKWILYQNRNLHLTLLYKNVISGAIHHCGELRADTPPDMIVKWVMEQDAARPGDLIRFPDGSVVQYINQQLQA